MADNYFVENIERITEQMIEEEIRDDIEQIRTSANSSIEKTKNEAETYINDKITELNDIKTAATNIYNDTVNIAGDTIAVIENDIRQMIVDNCYSIKYSNDGSGNVTVTIGK